MIMKGRTDSRLHVVVLGAAGNLGQRVVRALSREKKMETAVFIHRKGNVPGKVFTGDVLNPSTMDEIFRWADVVVNCSGKVSYFRQDSAGLYRIHVKGTENILELCSRHNRKLVHTSSAAIYGFTKKPSCPKEKDLSKNRVYATSSAYSISKYESDIAVRDSGVDHVILRPAVLLSQKSETLNGILKVLKMKMDPDLTGGASFVDIDDVAGVYPACVKLLAGKKKCSKAYNLGGENLPFRSVIDAMKAALKIKTILKVPAPVLGAIGGINDFFFMKMLAGESLRFTENYSYVDSSLAVREIGYSMLPMERVIRKIYTGK